MQIEKKQIAYNRVARSGAIKYIVIHDTGNKSKGAKARMRTPISVILTAETETVRRTFLWTTKPFCR